jgi:hypothetical protein
MCCIRSFRFAVGAAFCLSLAPVASHSAAFVSYLEPVSTVAPVVIDHNLANALTLSSVRPVSGWLPDAYIEGYYVDSLHGALLPLGRGIVGLFEPGTGQSVFRSWMRVAVQTYDGFHAQYVFTEYHSRNDRVADVLTGLQGATYWGGLDADGSVQNLGSVVFPGATFDIYVQSAPVPEPEAYAMMLTGLGLLGVLARCRRKIAATA